MTKTFSLHDLHAKLAENRLEVEVNFQIIEREVAHAKKMLKAKRLTEAAIHLQTIGVFAWHNYSGVYSHAGIETILSDIAASLYGGSAVKGRVQKPEGKPHVLHVLTQAQTIGGHTRFAYRWIEQDKQHAHSLALTRQNRMAMPAGLIIAVKASGGQIYELDRQPRPFLQRALLLRSLALACDLVVLHIHPYDVIPSLAFLEAGAPPVVFLNHADHVYWTGRNATNVVANIRLSALELTLARRGVPAEHAAILPIPLKLNSRTLSRKEAKKQLGIPPERILLLSVASAYKYRPIGPLDPTTIWTELVKAHQNALLFVVGPQKEDNWQRTNLESDGRIRALGILEDVSLLYQAADIYLDSFPFPSLTSLLEAGSYGTPVVSFNPLGEELGPLHADDPALSRAQFLEADIAAYLSRIASLIADEGRRQELGKMMQANIGIVHAGQAWQEALAAIYSLAQQREKIPAEQQLNRSVTSADLYGLALHQQSLSFSQAERHNIRLLPLHQRVIKFIEGRRKGESLGNVLLSEWLEGWRSKHLKLWRPRRSSGT